MASAKEDDRAAARPEHPCVTLLRASACGVVGIGALAVLADLGRSGQRGAVQPAASFEERAIELASLVVTQEGLRAFASRCVGADGNSGARTYHFREAPRGQRAVVSLSVWAPLFSGLWYGFARLFLQVDRDHSLYQWRQEHCAPSDEAAPPAAPKTAQRAPAAASESWRFGSDGGDEVTDASDDGMPHRRAAAAPTAPRTQSPPALRTPGTTRSTPSNAHVTFVEPRRSHDQQQQQPPQGASPATSSVASSRPSVPRLSTQALPKPRVAATPEEEDLLTPPAAALRGPDTATLAVVTPCTVLDVNALLTAAAKYGVSLVVVPHGSARRRDSSGRVAGSTPRPGEPVERAAPATCLSHVTSRRLEFVGRFQRTVHICEMEAGVALPQFVASNAESIHAQAAAAIAAHAREQQSRENGQAAVTATAAAAAAASGPSRPVTVAVHRQPVAGATYLPEFEHPASAIYCFAKEPGSLTSSPLRQSAGTMPFGSPLRPDNHRSLTDMAHRDATQPLTPTRPVEPAAPEPLDFCDYHVFIRDDGGRHSLAATVNIVLYDRAVKSRRPARRK